MSWCRRELLSREWGSMWDWDWMEGSDWPTGMHWINVCAKWLASKTPNSKKRNCHKHFLCVLPSSMNPRRWHFAFANWRLWHSLLLQMQQKQWQQRVLPCSCTFCCEDKFNDTSAWSQPNAKHFWHVPFQCKTFSKVENCMHWHWSSAPRWTQDSC